MNAKKLVIGVALLSCVAAAWGLSVPKGERRMLSLGFTPERYLVSAEGRDCIQVTLPPAGSGEDRVVIEGKREGRCDVTFYENGAERTREEVTVTSGLENRKKSLARELAADLPGLSVETSYEKLVVKGVVNKPSDWALLEQILAMDAYRGRVENRVRFEVDDRTINDFRRQLQGMGFRVTELPPQSIGTLQVVYKDKHLVIAGTVYSDEEKADIEALVDRMPWLKRAGNATSNGADQPRVICVPHVKVDQELVQLTAAIMGVSEQESRRIGAGVPHIESFFSVFYDFLTGRHGTRTMKIQGSINQTLEAFAGSGIIRDIEKDSMTFHLNRNDGEEHPRIKWGGILKLKLQSRDGDGNLNQSFENVEYGFSVEKVSAKRISADTVELHLKVEQRLQPEPISNEDGTSWKMEENIYNPVIECKLGETVLVGGYEKMREVSDLPSGMPVLRHIPIINWFVSSEGHVDTDINMVMAICVERMGAESAEAPVTLPKDITGEVRKANAERLKEKQRFHGCWAPLNWLAW